MMLKAAETTRQVGASHFIVVSATDASRTGYIATSLMIVSFGDLSESIVGGLNEKTGGARFGGPLDFDNQADAAPLGSVGVGNSSSAATAILALSSLVSLPASAATIGMLCAPRGSAVWSAS